MAFINMRGFLVDRAEWNKYKNLYVQANGGKGSLGSGSWTIDRDRGLLLVCLSIEREDMYEGNFHRSRWVFYWQGEWIRFLQHDYSEKISENYWRKTREVKEMIIPDAIKKEKVTIFNDLKEAFKAYGRGGAGKEEGEYGFDLTLDVSEVQ